MTHLHAKSIPPTTEQGQATTPAADLQLGMRWMTLVILLGLLLAIFLMALALGSVNIPLDDVVRVLLGGDASKPAWTNIILKFRLPKAVTAILAGAALSVSGVQMQTFFRNPLAGPFVLGINSGASLGVAVVVLSVGTVGGTLIAGIGMVGDFMLAIAAGIGAALTMLIVLLVARRVESSMTLLILGLMFGYLTGAMVSLLLHFSITERIHAYINWTFGSFGGVSWTQMQILAPLVLIGLGIAFALSKSLNALLLGEAYARSMGLNVQRTRIGIVIGTAILAGTITAFCGPVAFIGIAVPHLCRSLFGTSNHRILIPTSIIVGAIIALVAALIAELPGSKVILPLNAVTALIGSPIVIWVILRQRNLQKSFAS